MSRNNELVKNTVILTVGKICTQFITFLLLPIYTSVLLAEEYGLIDLFNSCVMLLVPIISLQFESGLFRFLLDVRGQREKQTELVSTVLIVNIVQILIFLFLSVYICRYIFVDYILFLLLDVVISIFFNMLLQFSRGIGNNKVYACASFIVAACTVALNILLIIYMHLGIVGMLLATCMGKALACVYIIFALQVWNYIKIRTFNRNVLGQICKYSIPLIPNQLSWWIIGMSDRIVVSWCLGVSKNGIYAVANKFSALYITIYNIFHMAWVENVALYYKDKDNEKFVEDTINIVISLFFSICLFVIAIMPFLFDFFVADDYAEAYLHIPILMIAALFQVISGLLSVIYIALGKTKEIAKTSLWTSIINFVVDVGLINNLGLYAASCSTLIAYFSMVIYRYLDVRKYINIRIFLKPLFLYVLLGVIIVITYYLRISTYCMLLLAGMVIIGSIINNKKSIRIIYNLLLEKMKR